MVLNERARKYDPDSSLSNILSWSETIVQAVFAVVLIFTFVLKIVIVNGSSMENTLFQDDRLIISHLLYDPQRGDIVAIDSQNMNEVIIKRVIGVSNDTVEIDYDAGTVTVNGSAVNEQYIKEQMFDTGSFSDKFYNEDKNTYTYKVPFGYVFVMGDNRNHSTDGRAIGLVSEDEIVGRVVYRFYSQNGDTGKVE